MSRRAWLLRGAGLAVASPCLVQAQQPTRTLRMLLNTGTSSPLAWLWLAISRGYLAAQGITLDLTPGAGAYTAAPRMADDAFDLAYGDVNALIELCARRPEAAPKGVYMMFNASPSCVLVAADGPLRHPGQLIGQRLIGHGTDVALRTFGALYRQLNLDAGKVPTSQAWAGMAGMAEEVLSGPAAGAFGYESTFTGALTAADPSLLQRVRFLRHADFVPDLYGSVVMASRRMLRDEPELVSSVVKALNRGVVDMLRDPEAGLEVVLRASPGLHREAERARLRATLDLEMNPARPEGASPVALGDVDLARFQRSIALMVAGSGLARTPSAQEVFTQAHLPPTADRARP